MDPYLERHWLDIRTSLVTYSADDLNQRLPPDLVAVIDARDGVDSECGDDYAIVSRLRAPAASANIASAVESRAHVPATRYRLLAQTEPITERFIKVVDAGTDRLITVIEFISPTNKRGGKGIHAFVSKRASLLASGVNFVEVDLVRAGDWRALLRPHNAPRDDRSPYRYTVRLAREPATVYLEPISLRERLPSVPIPLRRADPEIRIELQPLIERAYVNGRYDRRKIYDRPLDPPLDGEDATWADALVREAGRR